MGMRRIITSTVLAIIIFGLISCTQNLSENTLTNNESPFKKETTFIGIMERKFLLLSVINTLIS